MLHGIDISEHNGDISLKGQDFVIIRAGYDIKEDRWFEANCRKAERAGIPYGVYWYSYALTQKSALEEAQACVKTIQGKRIQCGVWFDMEDADGYKRKHGWQMTRDNISAICETFCKHLHEAGYYAGIYASHSWLYGSGRLIDCPEWDKWVAHYGQSNDGQRHGDYSDIGSMHQYTSNPIDKDVMYFGLEKYTGEPMKTFKEFYEKYNGKAIDDDGAYGVQCVDGFRVFCREFGVPVKPTPNNWADGYWYSRDALGYGQYFEYITDPKQFKDGDVVIWAKGSKSHPSSHIAFWYQGKEFGQNQGGNRGFLLKPTDFSDALGALRLKAWVPEPYTGWKKQNGRWYYLRRDERLTGWQQLKWSGGYDWFYFKENGVMITGLHWLEWKGVSQWYYFSPRTGAMQTGDIMLTLNFGKSGKLTGEAKV